eukprot:GEMP01065242.1.p1 GENE.GEMP01065242.1~~GEMP01065242.1.p1  ORF type:complete len:316 (+),score=24.23 GEMP01065242.1:210-1157(+)
MIGVLFIAPSVCSAFILETTGTKFAEPTFHFIVTTNDDTFGMRHLRTVESALYHHPRAEIIIHSSTMTSKPIDALHTYNVRVKEFSIASLAARFTLMAAQRSLRTSSPDLGKLFTNFLNNTDVFSGQYSSVHQADLARLCFLYLYGGIYLDTDMIVVKPLYGLKNVVGFESAGVVNNAVMIFDKKNVFLEECIREFLTTYREDLWSYNGPELVTRLVTGRVKNMVCNGSNASSCQVTLLAQKSFYPMQYQEVEPMCFNAKSNGTSEMRKIIDDESFVVHLNNKITGRQGKTRENTLCRYLLNAFCVTTPTCSTIV